MIKFKTKRTVYRGVTLLELLIVIAIIAILATLSWRALRQAKDATFVDNACQMVAGEINKARTYALTGKMGAGNCVPARFEVGITGSVINISGDAGCAYGPETTNIAHGVTCSINNASGVIRFRVPHGITVGVGDVDCQSADGSIVRTVEVTETKATCKINE